MQAAAGIARGGSGLVPDDRRLAWLAGSGPGSTPRAFSLRGPRDKGMKLGGMVGISGRLASTGGSQLSGDVAASGAAGEGAGTIVVLFTEHGHYEPRRRRAANDQPSCPIS